MSSLNFIQISYKFPLNIITKIKTLIFYPVPNKTNETISTLQSMQTQPLNTEPFIHLCICPEWRGGGLLILWYLHQIIAFYTNQL